MDIYDIAIRRLKAEKRSFNELECLTGVPAETLRDIAHGITKSPRFDTVKQLAKFYGREAA